MLDTYMKLRPGSSFWQIRVPVPKDVQGEVGQKEHTRSLRERDPVKAQSKAIQILARLHAEWDAIRERRAGGRADASAQLVPGEAELLAIARDAFDVSATVAGQLRARQLAENAEGYDNYLERQERDRIESARRLARGDLARWVPTAARLAEKNGYVVDRDAAWFKRLTEMLAEVTLVAIERENRRDRGELSPVTASNVLKRAEEIASDDAAGRKDVTFAELVKAYMVQWRAGSGSKETNTEAQKLSTFRMFEGYWRNQAIRGVRPEHAAEFRDTIKLLEPTWSRSPAARQLGWDALVAQYGNRPKGLSDATMNRHMAALQSLWKWAERRGHCEGTNPFSDFHVKLRAGVNVAGYLPWEPDELKRLFDPAPKRGDLCEIMIVGMFTGMRIDEIASLTWGQLRAEGTGEAAISYFDVDDAKTLSGIRQVPVHPGLDWLLRRTRGAADERIWSTFNEEGPGKKPGADAGKEFSRFKIDRGFADRRKVFHSFRKNVVGQLERLSVPESEVAQLVGHEKGFTFRTYGGGVTLARKAEIIRLISYPGLTIPHPV